MKIYFGFLVFFLLIVSCMDRKEQDTPIVSLRYENNKYLLYRHGKPYYIKGVGGHEQPQKVAANGGNSIRTWNTQEASKILDQAADHGLTVTLGLEVGREWWGSDFSFSNLRMLNQKIFELKVIVEKYKDHPALLMWGIGNEVELHGGNRLMIYILLNRIAKMIHETDPNHPVMTTVPFTKGFKNRGLLHIICPEIDILGVNVFQKVPDLYKQIRNPLGWKKAYILSEWGAPGPYDTQSTNWGAPLEPNSALKAAYIEYNWNIISKDTSLCLGGYAFYWGKKYERTETFMSLFPEDGFETESVNVLQHKWSGKIPLYKAPVVDSLLIFNTSKNENKYLVSESLYTAEVFANDPQNDSLFFKWELRPEGLSNFIEGNFSKTLSHLISQDNCKNIQFKAPKDEGGYRLMVSVFNSYQKIATHNIPFYVIYQ